MMCVPQSEVLKHIDKLQRGRDRPTDCRQALLWFLEFIDTVDSPAEINAYIEALDEHRLVLC